MITALLALALVKGVQAQITSNYCVGDAPNKTLCIQGVLSLEPLASLLVKLQDDIAGVQARWETKLDTLNRTIHRQLQTLVQSGSSQREKKRLDALQNFFLVGNARFRLVNGSANSGRLEVWHKGEWGTMCDDRFGPTEAKTFCKKLGLPWTNAMNASKAAFGEGTGRKWLDEVNCKYTNHEASLCVHTGWGHGDCNHGEDVGIRCS